MNERPRPRLRHFALVLSSLAVVAGCVGSSASSAQPSGWPSAPATSASPPPATASAQPSVTASPSPAPSLSPASASPAACTLPTPGPLASDTLVNATLERTPSGSRLVFTFGNRPPEAVAQPTMAVTFEEPPFSMAASGQPFTVIGDRFLQVKMDGMVIGRPNGSPVYEGKRNLRLAGGIIPQAVLYDDSEGVVGWIVGLDGSGCPTIRRDTSGGEQVVITLDR